MSSSCTSQEVLSCTSSACDSLLPPINRTSVSSSAALRLRLLDLEGCLAASEGASQRHAYYQVVPLLFARLLQLRLYARVLGCNESSRFASWDSRLAALTLTIDPRRARNRLQQHHIDAALAAYRLRGRSGLRQHSGHESARAQPNPRSSMHIHLHLTNHGGTTMQNMVLYGPARQLVHYNANIGLRARDLGGPNPTRDQMEASLLTLDANITAQYDDAFRTSRYYCRGVPTRSAPQNVSWFCRNGSREELFAVAGSWLGPGWSNESTRAPIDFAQFEPSLPAGALA